VKNEPLNTQNSTVSKTIFFFTLSSYIPPISTFILGTGMIRLKRNSTYSHTHSRCPDAPIQNILLLIWTNPPATQPYSPIHLCSVSTFRMVLHLFIQQISFPVVKYKTETLIRVDHWSLLFKPIHTLFFYNFR